MVDLAAIAMSLPDVTTGVACGGTPIESRTFLTNKKAFLFVSKKDVRLKLAASAGDAKKAGCEVGANGWVKILLDAMPATAALKKWIAESHSLMAPAAKAPRAKAGEKAAAKKRAKPGR